MDLLRPRWIVCVLVVLSTQTLIAQQTESMNPVGFRSTSQTLLVDEWKIWTSPFRKGSYSPHTVKKYLVPFVLISGGLIAADRKIADRFPNSIDQAKWSGRVSQLGASYSLAGFAGGTYLLGLFTKNEHARETGLLSLQALAHTQVVVFGLKQLTNRQRPVDGDGRGGFWEGGNAFPSGHAASAFAVATVFSYEYRHHIAVPIVAYSLAGLVAASRIGAERHWASDIFVGGAAGFLLGRYVYRQHHDPSLPGSIVRRAKVLSPQIGVTSRTASLSWRW